jgi:hypothetical protein
MLNVNLSEITSQLSLTILPPLNVPTPLVVPDAFRIPVPAELVSKPQSLPKLHRDDSSVLMIEVPALNMQLSSAISNIITKNGYQEVVFESVVDRNVLAYLTLHSERSNGTGDDLQIKNASLSFRLANHKARTHFITDTLYAILGLGGPVNLAIPNIKVNLTLNFALATQEISNFLQLRQLEFGLLVIEKASGLEFDIPPHISGEEINSITFAYHAIVENQFEWRVNEITQPTPATEEMLYWFDSLKPIDQNGSVYKLMFGPTPSTRLILGKHVSLGQETILLEDAVIENAEVVRQELAKGDGQIVPIRIRPISRRGRYLFANAPRFHQDAWDETMKSFVAVDELLDKALASRYHELAFSTVAGLTHDEIRTITTRPELSEDAHLIRG